MKIYLPGDIIPYKIWKTIKDELHDLTAFVVYDKDEYQDNTITVNS